MSKPAILGGSMVRGKFPQHITDIGEDEKRLVLKVMASEVLSGFAASNDSRFHGGDMVRELERQVSGYYGVKHAVSFNSATSALHAAIAACGVGPGDEVITSPTTMTATASSILHTNGIPIFADIEDKTYGLDPAKVEELITDRTKCILVVNLFGHGAKLKELKEIADRHELFLVEDNCHAPGVKYHRQFTGTFGDIGILSLNYHKIFQCGEGGLAITNRDDLALKMELVRNHGEVVVEEMGIDDIANTLGWNYRMTELQAAVAIPQFKKMEKLNGIRVELAQELAGILSGFDFLRPPIVEEDCEHCFYLYPIIYDGERAGISRKVFCDALRAENFPILEGYVKPIYLQPIYQKLIAYGDRGCPFSCPHYEGRIDVQYGEGSCTVAERLWKDEFIVANFVKYPNTTEDMILFGKAVDRIMNHREELIARAAG